MNTEQILKIRQFSIDWITKVVATRRDYRERLIGVIDDLFPENIFEYDPYGMLDVENWDNGKYGGMGDRLTDLVEYDNIYELTKKAQSDISSTIRIAIDIFIKQSGGVVGFTIGDLKKMCDGEIPACMNKIVVWL